MQSMTIQSLSENASSPAFPGLEIYYGEKIGSYQGMLKREFFAIELMRELIASTKPLKDSELQGLAEYSVHGADCLIRALETEAD